MKPLVSVIFPVKNEEKNIEECIRAINNQTYKNIEMIVVDGNSTDNTVQISRKLGAKVVRESPARSPGNARNIGAKKARGKYIVFVDADSILDNDYVKNAVNVLENSKFDAVCHKSFLYPTHKLIPKLSHMERAYSKQDFNPNVYKRSAYLKILFNSKLVMGEDYDFRKRFDKKFKSVYLDYIKSYHKEPDLKRLIGESFWFGKTYFNILKKGYPKVLISFIWTSAVALMLPIVVVSFFVPILRNLALLLILLFSIYSLYKIEKMWDNNLKFLFPFFKILRYTLVFTGVIIGIFNKISKR